MSHHRDDTAWLKRGNQRSAVARVLIKPMIGSEILAAAREFAPCIQLRDVWHLLREMSARDLVRCLNPRLITGRLHVLTERGRATVREAFGITTPVPPANIDWRKYSWVIRAKARRLTLATLGELERKSSRPQTATAIFKRLPSANAMGLNKVIRAVKELVKSRLVRPAGKIGNRVGKRYGLTPMGRRILEHLKR